MEFTVLREFIAVDQRASGATLRVVGTLRDLAVHKGTNFLSSSELHPRSGIQNELNT